MRIWCKFIGEGYVDLEYRKVEYDKHEDEYNKAMEKRKEILNKLIDSKKTFIVVKEGGCRSGSDVYIDAEKILKRNNYPYFGVGITAGGGSYYDTTFFESKIDINNYKDGAITIIKDGKIYATVNPNVDNLSTEENVLNWLSKYIDVK